MANIKANAKSTKQDIIRNQNNRRLRSRVKNSIKKAEGYAKENNVEMLSKQISEANMLLDRAENKNLYHKNKVARHKQQLDRLSKGVQNPS